MSMQEHRKTSANLKLDRRSLMTAALAGSLVAAAATSADAAQAKASAPKTAGPDPFRGSDGLAVAKTEAGRVRGYIHNSIFTFKGIPYGADTGGAARFLPAQKPKPWTGLRSAMQYGPVSPQPDRDGWKNDEEAWMFAWNDGIQGEDCLRTNVWTPGLDGKKRPVMVWIHGGGHYAGSGQEQPGYDGENLARSGDVVVVSLNHRLGALGYIDFSRFGPEYKASANIGMQDIVLALEWVRDNIANFGGDPGCVTIMGQSGGGAKVSTLMVMPKAAGLFHRAVVQSGSSHLIGVPADANRLTDQVLAELGAAGTSMDAIKALPYRDLVQAAIRAQAKLRKPGQTNAISARGPRAGDFVPIVDGEIVVRHPFEKDAPPVMKPIPLMVGTVLNEQVHALNHPEYERMTEEEAKANLVKIYGAPSEGIFAAVRRRNSKMKPFDVYSLSCAGSARARAQYQAKMKSAQGGAPAYVFWFTWQTPVLDGRPRAFHCSEIAFAFNNTDVAGTLTGGSARARKLGHAMSQAWINFARHGNPNHADLPQWPAYSAAQRATMIFDDVCQVQVAPDREEQALIGAALGIPA